jgi:hypothetical protein
MFPAEGLGRQYEFIVAEQVGSSAWRVRSRWVENGICQSAFALIEATADDLREQAHTVAEPCGLVVHHLPSQPLPFHAPEVMILSRG